MLADVLGYSLRVVESGFPPAEFERRRLQYGKYKTSKIDIEKNIRCADAAEPKALGLFEYRDLLEH